jgi:peptidyl-prolyl cis-trans isomerase SurA
VLVLALLAPACGWLSAPAPAPTLPTSEAARASVLKAEVDRAPRPTVAPVAPPASPDVLDRVVAVVNNDVITLSELDDSVAFYLYESKETVKPGEEGALRERLLRRLIDSRLQLQEAARERIVAEEVELNEQVAEVMKRVNVKTQEELENVIKAQGLTFEAVKKRLREQVLIQKVLRRKVHLRVTVTEQEIEKYLRENREKLETGLSYRARHILLAVGAQADEPAWEAARVRSEEVWRRVRAGEDFGELARRFSEDPTAKDGGDLGVLKQGELAPEIETQILRLRPGEASAPFRSRFGLHIFRLEWKEGLVGEALTQARQQIREILLQQKYAVRLEAWLEEIKKRAVIEIRM